MVFISTISANPINVSVDKKAVFSTTIDQQGRQIVIEQHPTAVDKQLPIQFVPSVSTNSVATYSLNDNDVKIISDKKTLVKPQPDTDSVIIESVSTFPATNLTSPDLDSPLLVPFVGNPLSVSYNDFFNVNSQQPAALPPNAGLLPYNYGAAAYGIFQNNEMTKKWNQARAEVIDSTWKNFKK